ncbi:hypothetical protein [Arthrobacter sp. efr-133-R2A-120]|uniref:hypothetical protein n=1 Tax=Arthrobacter sp. efr-133-R2A-120 TaxID=3040277 RepID=UPI00254B5120|nr:hypothetical protein [Arthrobacter sp. efr-133-R2A-120]
MSTTLEMVRSVNTQLDGLLGDRIEGMVRPSGGGPIMATPMAVAVSMAAMANNLALAGAFTAGASAVVGAYTIGQAAGR